MPHTSRRRPNPTLKHQHLTTPDGWTHVFRGTSAQKHTPRPPLLSPTEISNGATLAKVQETYVKHTRQWRESEWCAELMRVLEQEVVPGVFGGGERTEGNGVQKCVVLGLGSLSGGDGREYSWWQLVALQTVLGAIRRFFFRVRRSVLFVADAAIAGSRSHDITDMIAQDPRFNSLDKEFLSSLSFTVVEDPVAFSSIGPSTFIYIPHGELEVTARALEGKEPVLYIGNDLDMWIENPTVVEEKKEVVKRWKEMSVSVAMAQSEGNTWCNNTRMYWKRPSSDEGADGLR